MFLPENIDLAYSEKYNLSIRLLPNGFSFCIYSSTDPNVFFYKEAAFGNKLSYAENIKKLVFDLGFFTQVFKKTEVVVVSGRFTLVPDEYFDARKVDELFNLNLVVDEDETVMNNSLCEGSIHLLFGINSEVHAFLHRSLWNPAFSHQMTRLIPALVSYNDCENQKRCFVDFRSSAFTICAYCGEQLLSANTFSDNEQSDVLYFIASVWEKLGFDQANDHLYLMGNTSAKAEVVETLKKLIKHVEYVEFTPKTVMTKEDKLIIPTDLKIMLCE